MSWPYDDCYKKPLSHEDLIPAHWGDDVAFSDIIFLNGGIGYKKQNPPTKAEG